MHTIKITREFTPNLLFEYQCTSGKFIRLPNRIESKFFFSPNWNALLRAGTCAKPLHAALRPASAYSSVAAAAAAAADLRITAMEAWHPLIIDVTFSRSFSPRLDSRRSTRSTHTPGHVFDDCALYSLVCVTL